MKETKKKLTKCYTKIWTCDILLFFFWESSPQIESNERLKFSRQWKIKAHKKCWNFKCVRTQVGILSNHDKIILNWLLKFCHEHFLTMRPCRTHARTRTLTHIYTDACVWSTTCMVFRLMWRHVLCADFNDVLAAVPAHATAADGNILRPSIVSHFIKRKRERDEVLKISIEIQEAKEIPLSHKVYAYVSNACSFFTHLP